MPGKVRVARRVVLLVDWTSCWEASAARRVLVVRAGLLLWLARQVVLMRRRRSSRQFEGWGRRWNGMELYHTCR